MKNPFKNPRKRGENSRSLGLSPRQLGLNPRTLGINPRELATLSPAAIEDRTDALRALAGSLARSKV